MIKLPFLKLKIEKGDKMDKIRRLEEGLQGSFMFIDFFSHGSKVYLYQ